MPVIDLATYKPPPYTFWRFLKDVFKAIPLYGWTRVILLLAAYLVSSTQWVAGLITVLVILLVTAMQTGIIELDRRDVEGRDATIHRLLTLAATQQGLNGEQSALIDKLLKDAGGKPPPRSWLV